MSSRSSIIYVPKKANYYEVGGRREFNRRAVQEAKLRRKTVKSLNPNFHQTTVSLGETARAKNDQYSEMKYHKFGIREYSPTEYNNTKLRVDYTETSIERNKLQARFDTIIQDNTLTKTKKLIALKALQHQLRSLYQVSLKNSVNTAITKLEESSFCPKIDELSRILDRHNTDRSQEHITARLSRLGEESRQKKSKARPYREVSFRQPR